MKTITQVLLHTTLLGALACALATPSLAAAYQTEMIDMSNTTTKDFVVGPGKIEVTLNPGEHKTVNVTVTNRMGDTRCERGRRHPRPLADGRPQRAARCRTGGCDLSRRGRRRARGCRQQSGLPGQAAVPGGVAGHPEALTLLADPHAILCRLDGVPISQCWRNRCPASTRASSPI